jgi:hypothetical protein
MFRVLPGGGTFYFMNHAVHSFYLLLHIKQQFDLTVECAIVDIKKLKKQSWPSNRIIITSNKLL